MFEKFVFDHNAFYSLYKEFVSNGLSKLDLNLLIIGEKIKLVNNN